MDFVLLVFTSGSQDPSFLSCTPGPAPAMNSLTQGILERTAPLPAPASTSTNTKPKRCIVAGWTADFPSSAPAPALPAPETKASSPPAHIAAPESPLAP